VGKRDEGMGSKEEEEEEEEEEKEEGENYPRLHHISRSHPSLPSFANYPRLSPLLRTYHCKASC